MTISVSQPVLSTVEGSPLGTPDPPYYQPARDGRRVHICAMPGHSRYWLNVWAALWVCERCHPPVSDCALAERWEIVEAAKAAAGE